MAEDIYEISMLLDFYGQLLTDNQYMCMDMYYNQDLSLSEIADEIEISRQGVHDFIKRGRAILADYEKISKFAGFIDSKLGDTSHSKLVSYINRDNYSDFINAISQDDIVNYRDVNNSNFKLILTYIKDNNL